LWRWIPESVAEFDDDLHDDPDHDDVWLTEFDDDHVAWHVELTQFVNVLRRVSRVRRMHAFQR
jgi:hypothetical protein